MEACFDPDRLEEILGRYPREETSLIQVLQDVQRTWNYLPCEVLAAVSKSLRVPLAKVFSVATFYKAFSLTPQGRTIVKVCLGTACHIRGGEQLVDAIRREKGIRPGETSPDREFTLLTVNCVGACAMAPIVIVGEKYNGGALPAKIAKYLAEGAADEN